MATIFERANDALKVNPPFGTSQTLTTKGSNWLWAVTAVFLLLFLAVWALALKPTHNERIFHYIFKVALLTGGIAYFAMASDLGWVVAEQANQRSRGDSRQVFWAKYVYWVVSFPAAILSLGLLSGVSWATIVFNIFVSWIWVVAYLAAAFTATNYKWGFFAFGTTALGCLAVTMLTAGRTSAARVGSRGHYVALAGYTVLLWALYPIAFGLSDGGNRIGVTGSFVFFGILDILMIPVLAAAFMVLGRKWDYSNLNLHFTQFGRVARGAHVVEKEPATTGGVTGAAAV
jgi:bacteriorhodopsin